MHPFSGVDLALGKCNDTFTMPCSGKKVHRLHLLRMIPVLFEPCGISCGGGGVATDIDHPAGGHLDDGGKGRLGQAEVLKRRTQSVSPSIIAGFARRAAPAARIACGADVGAHRSPASMIAYHARLREVPREYPVTRGIADATGRGGECAWAC